MILPVIPWKMLHGPPLVQWTLFIKPQTDIYSYFQAHKVILAACSPFFDSLFSTLDLTPNSTNPHPVVFLRGVKASDMERVLDFVYRGEVNVAQEELNSFLAVAEDLKIKGWRNIMVSSNKIEQSNIVQYIFDHKIVT